MRIAGAVGLVGMWLAVAQAKPLPSGMVASIKKGKPFLSTLGVSVQLVDNREDWSELNVELSDDGDTMLVWSARCGMSLDPEETPRKIPMTIVNAKLENARGMALQAKKKYADAVKLFEQAWSHDHDAPLYATNYLSALSMSRQVDAATKLLDEGIAADFVAYLGWRLAVDPQLKALAATASGKKLRAEKPSKLTVKKLATGAAESPLGVGAIATRDSSGNVYLSFVELKSGRETMRLPIKTAAQLKEADKVLQVMGFEASANPRVTGAAAKQLVPTAIGEVAAAVDLGTSVIYLQSTSGCEAADFDWHATAIVVPPAPAP